MDNFSTEEVRKQLQFLGYDQVDDDTVNKYVKQLQQFHNQMETSDYIQNPLLEPNPNDDNDITPNKLNKENKKDNPNEYFVPNPIIPNNLIVSNKAENEKKEEEEEEEEIFGILNNSPLQQQYNDLARLMSPDLDDNTYTTNTASFLFSDDDINNKATNELSSLPLSSIASNSYLANNDSFLSQTNETISNIIQCDDDDQNINNNKIHYRTKKYQHKYNRNNSSNTNNYVNKRKRKQKGFKSSDPVSLYQKFNNSWKKDRFLNKKTTKQSQSFHALSNRLNSKK